MTTPLVVVTQAGTPRHDVTLDTGCKFTVDVSNITVSSVGRWMLTGNSQTHAITIYDPTGMTPLGSATVNMSGQTPGAFVYAALSSNLVLLANTVYYMFSVETLNGDDFCDAADTNVTWDAAFTNVIVAHEAYYRDPSDGSIHSGPDPHMFGPVSLLFVLGGTPGGGSTGGGLLMFGGSVGWTPLLGAAAAWKVGQAIRRNATLSRRSLIGKR